MHQKPYRFVPRPIEINRASNLLPGKKKKALKSVSGSIPQWSYLQIEFLLLFLSLQDMAIHSLLTLELSWLEKFFSYADTIFIYLFIYFVSKMLSVITLFSNL